MSASGVGGLRCGLPALGAAEPRGSALILLVAYALAVETSYATPTRILSSALPDNPPITLD